MIERRRAECGGEEKGVFCEVRYSKLDGERVISVRMWEGGKEMWWSCS